MELKDYQQQALEQVKRYLELLAKERGDGNKRHAGEDAWEQLFGARNYIEKRNGLGEDLPTFCLKIPTGGGKTLLAAKTIDLINTYYVKRQTGLVLWVVPSRQIYQQTLHNLRNREHPYRQQLDIASGGRTIVVERTDRLTPQDVAENLVVLMLMLPAANRESKEQLRMFRDSGAFENFFPPDDNYEEHAKLLARIPNLDVFGDENGFFGRQAKTSLGNVLRLLRPIIILDESHKAYSERAKATLYGFNPSIICELSATPREGSNILVDISGRQLYDENMIKLDLHLINKGDLDWKRTLLASKEHLNKLEAKAREYEAETGEYIRPIEVIQVERTGRDQRDGQRIHSEDVREHLINVIGVPAEQVVVKTSETDELQGISNEVLLSRDCPIRFIITKQALQEGWDCPFAYVLAILNEPRSRTALTQLVGRILRQPFARKTGVAALDESYVFTYQRSTDELIHTIQRGFEGEGLGDLNGRIRTEGNVEGEVAMIKQSARPKYEQAVREILLPMFVIESPKWRPVNYDTDIAAVIDWNEVDLEPLYNLPLTQEQKIDRDIALGYSEDGRHLFDVHVIRQLQSGSFNAEPAFLSRHLLEVVPNPWRAYEIGERVLARLVSANSKEHVANNFIYIIQECLKYLASERDRLAEAVFRDLLEAEKLRFIVVKKTAYQFPETNEVTAGRELRRRDYTPLQRSLFEFEPVDSMNEAEKAVAWFLDEQSKLFFWYRNVDRKKDSYFIQGWRKQRVYPDFLFTLDDNNDGRVEKVYVVEFKGDQLEGSSDTEYKHMLLKLCNDLAEQRDFSQLALELKDKRVKFEMIFESDWQQKLAEIVA